MQCIIKGIGALILTILASPFTSAKVAPLAPGIDVGMWVWNREEVEDAPTRDQLIQFSKDYGITRIFVQVRFEQKGDTLALSAPDSWRALLASAHAAGIKIEALDGEKSMAFAENQATTLRKLDAVLAFHCSLPPGQGFSGLHYDIEPYLSERWKKGDTAGVMQETLQLFTVMRDKVKAADPGLTLSYDIPAWYNTKPNLQFEFNGTRKNFHEHIQDLSDYVGVMSYRTKGTGPNSALAISQEELAYAASLGRKAYVSLETVRLIENPNITFYGRSAEDLLATVREIQTAGANQPGFGGILIHQYRTLRTLLESPAAGKTVHP